MRDSLRERPYAEYDTLLGVEIRDDVGILLRVMRQFDAATAEHLEAVGDLATGLAVHLRLADAEVCAVRHAARLHDIGKISVSRHILLKATPLSADEWEDVKLHPIHGASSLAGIPRLKAFSVAVRHHHERIDGRGYPDGLRGDEIPVASRIIAIADAFHAMTVPRPYSSPRHPVLAIEELLRCAGRQFDEDYAFAFAELLGYQKAESRSRLA